MKRHYQPADGRVRRFFFFLLFFGGILLAALFVLYTMLGSIGISNNRLSLLVLGGPLEVASLDTQRNEWTTIQFPLDTTIKGVRGYGDYRVESLWQLARSEATPSGVVLESLTDEFGVPIDRYIGKKSQWEKRTGEGGGSRDIFTLSHLLPFLTGTYDTNVTIPEFIALIKKNGRETKTKRLVLSIGNGLQEKFHADQTPYKAIDRQMLDHVTDDAFLDVNVAKEKKRVAVYNTTGIPAIGARVARILTNLGANVVAVGNKEKKEQECLVVGTRQALRSYTGILIASLFSCKKEEMQEEQQGDVTINVGMEYAKKFVPRE